MELKFMMEFMMDVESQYYLVLKNMILFTIGYYNWIETRTNSKYLIGFQIKLYVKGYVKTFKVKDKEKNKK